jgi:hypothetical protein
LQDLQMDPETSKDPELSAEIIKRKKALQKDADKYEDDDTMDVKINSKGQMMHPNTPDDMDGEEGDDRTPGQKLEELVKSYYDYTTNNFPKGEQAVITACEKEFGENSVPVAEKMIGRLMAGQDNEMERIKSLAGINN